MSGNNGSIRLHPVYGINPTVGVCFWCGNDSGDVALLGVAYKGAAPQRMVVSFEPCPKCKANMDKGITVIEATTYKRDAWQHEVQAGAFPTGRWCVVRREAEVFNHVTEPMRSQVLAAGKMFMEPEAYESLGFAQPAVEYPAP